MDQKQELQEQLDDAQQEIAVLTAQLAAAQEAGLPSVEVLAASTVADELEEARRDAAAARMRSVFLETAWNAAQKVGGWVGCLCVLGGGRVGGWVVARVMSVAGAICACHLLGLFLTLFAVSVACPALPVLPAERGREHPPAAGAPRRLGGAAGPPLWKDRKWAPLLSVVLVVLAPGPGRSRLASEHSSSTTRSLICSLAAPPPPFCPMLLHSSGLQDDAEAAGGQAPDWAAHAAHGGFPGALACPCGCRRLQQQAGGLGRVRQGLL